MSKTSLTNHSRSNVLYFIFKHHESGPFPKSNLNPSPNLNPKISY